LSDRVFFSVALDFQPELAYFVELPLNAGWQPRTGMNDVAVLIVQRDCPSFSPIVELGALAPAAGLHL